MQNHTTEFPRAPLSVRIFRKLWRDLASLTQYAYLYVYAVPRLWVTGDLSCPFSVSRGYGSFLLRSRVTFLKLANSKRPTIDKEYENYRKLTEKLPDLVEILPQYRYLKGRLLSALRCERLLKVAEPDALLLAIEVRRRLDHSVRIGARLTLSQCEQIIAGTDCIAVELGDNNALTMRKLAADFLEVGKYHVGLAHGDFHSRNIMCDQLGNCRLIDLDCVRLEGITEFDALYFALELEWSNSGALWTETLGRCFETQGENIAIPLEAFEVHWSDGLGVAFFLDRIGQDFANYGIRYPKEQLAFVVDCLYARRLLRLN